MSGYPDTDSGAVKHGNGMTDRELTNKLLEHGAKNAVTAFERFDDEPALAGVAARLAIKQLKQAVDLISAELLSIQDANLVELLCGRHDD
jgi:hypothetical protein